MLATFSKGFIVSFGLIVSIGAQNAFVLKQGLLHQYIFWVCLTCFICDFVLMSIGVLGLGTLISQNLTVTLVLAVAGALFLFVYGLRAFVAAYRNTSGLIASTDTPKASLGKTIATTLALTLLNPHVYIDTIMLIGTVAATLSQNQKYLFLIGSCSASVLRFFSLGYGARLLNPLFKKPNTWRVLDIIIGSFMWMLAINLLYYAYQKHSLSHHV